MMKKIPLSLMFSLAMCVSMFAGEIYVFHDSSCMDKLQFKEKTLTADYKLKTTGNLISYNIHANENELIRLDINPESEEILSDMPIGTKNCNELIWDEQFSKDINAQVTDIYVVTLVDGKYRISPVDRASYFYSSDDEISYSDEVYGFSFDMGEFDPNADLLTYGLKSKVKFSFADDMHCPGEYHFYKSTRNRNLSENEVVAVPHIGIIRNFTISKKLNRNLRELDLEMVNDMPLSMFMEQECNKTTTKTAVTQVEENITKETPTTKEMAKASNIDINATSTVAKPTEKIVEKTTEKVIAKGNGRTLQAATLPGSNASNTVTETCHHIYRNADTGFYYNRNTGKTAEGECGGITYLDGKMQNSDYQETTATTALISNAPIGDEFVAKGGEVITSDVIIEVAEGEAVKTVTETIIVETKVTDTPNQKVIITETKPKIVYKEPKVIYSEANPIVINETLEPQDTKIVAAPNTISNATPYTKSNTFTNDCTVSPRTGFHVVKKGETLYKLSNMYNASIEDLMKWNTLNSSAISVCQHLRVQPEVSLTQNAVRIPANEFVSKGGTVNTTTIVTKSAPVKRVYHYITQGETLYGISKKYGVNVEDVKRLNKLSDNYLKPGWRLSIPNSSDSLNAAPAVQKVDAQPMFKEAAPAIQQETSSDSKLLMPKGGSSMKIPESSEEHLSNYQNQHIYHTVGEDETINDIAMKYGTSINALKLLNAMGEGEVLIPFQKIKVR